MLKRKKHKKKVQRNVLKISEGQKITQIVRRARKFSSSVSYSTMFLVSWLTRCKKD